MYGSVCTDVHIIYVLSCAASLEGGCNPISVVLVTERLMLTLMFGNHRTGDWHNCYPKTSRFWLSSTRGAGLAIACLRQVMDAGPGARPRSHVGHLPKACSERSSELWGAGFPPGYHMLATLPAFHMAGHLPLLLRYLIPNATLGSFPGSRAAPRE
jgi:hypothetical protein